MSNIEKFAKKTRRTCAKCGKSKNGFRVQGGRYKSDSDHDLCQRCWRGLHTQTVNETKYGETA